MYGNTQENTENAMKAAKHELRSSIAFYDCKIPQLRTPLMALIDWHGFRFVTSLDSSHCLAVHLIEFVHL